MKKIIKMLYFLILSLVFFSNTGKAMTPETDCYLVFKDLKNQVSLIRSPNYESCNYYYDATLGDFSYVEVKRYFVGSKQYEEVKKYVQKHFISINTLTDQRKIKRQGKTKMIFLVK